jgi:hypothetical protein
LEKFQRGVAAIKRRRRSEPTRQRGVRAERAQKGALANSSGARYFYFATLSRPPFSSAIKILFSRPSFHPSIHPQQQLARVCIYWHFYIYLFSLSASVSRARVCHSLCHSDEAAGGAHPVAGALSSQPPFLL